MIDFETPRFSYPAALRLTDVDRKSIENWITYRHADASGEDRNSRFSLRDLLLIVLISRLRNPFNVQAETASKIARDAVENYAPTAEHDIVDIWQGGSPAATAYRATYGLNRTQDGELVPLSGFVADVDPLDGVQIVIPVGLLARSLFLKAKTLLDAAEANASEKAVA